VEYVVAGYMRRSVTFDRKYEWGEYLLFEREKGFRWLVESDHHWSFVWPIAAGDVLDGMRGTEGVAKTLVVDNRTFKIFQVAMAKVEKVIGEFYWKVAVGETVRTFDYVSPPMAISKEISSSMSKPDVHPGRKKAVEVNYSQSRYMPVAEVEKAFGIAGLRRPTTVGMQQPYQGKPVFPLWLKFVGALIVIALLLALRGPYGDVLSEAYSFTAPTDIGVNGGATSTSSSSVVDSASATTATETAGAPPAGRARPARKPQLRRPP